MKRFYFGLAIGAVIMIGFSGIVIAQKPANVPNSNANAAVNNLVGLQVYDGNDNRVGTLLGFNEDFRATVAVDVEDIYGNLRRVMMHLQRPNGIFAQAFGNASAYFTTIDCSGGQPYQIYLAEPSFPVLSEKHSTTILNGTALEVWLPTTDTAQNEILLSSKDRNGTCSDLFGGWEVPVVPLERIVIDFFSQFPPPYDVR